MSAQRSQFCPYCFTTFIGIALILGIPGLSKVNTAMGSMSILLIGIPALCAALRLALLNLAARPIESAAAQTLRIQPAQLNLVVLRNFSRSR